MKKRSTEKPGTILVERVQTGVRLEKKLLKVLRAVADYLDMTLGDLLEGIVLHSFDGKTPFSSETLRVIHKFKQLYGMTLDSTASHRLKEREKPPQKRQSRGPAGIP